MDVANQPRRLLGLLLIEMGLISEEQLLSALAEQERTRELLGEILVGLGYVTRLAVQDALASQRGVSLVVDPGFGGGLRDELIRRESRRNPSADQAPLGLHMAFDPSREPLPDLRSEARPVLEPELKRELRWLFAEVAKHEQRLEDLEVDKVPAARAETPDFGPADNLSEPFLASMGRARKHLVARRAALRERSSATAPAKWA